VQLAVTETETRAPGATTIVDGALHVTASASDAVANASAASALATTIPTQRKAASCGQTPSNGPIIAGDRGAVQKPVNRQ
jgi:hypothetical protein